MRDVDLGKSINTPEQLRKQQLSTVTTSSRHDLSWNRLHGRDKDTIILGLDVENFAILRHVKEFFSASDQRQRPRLHSQTILLQGGVLYY